MKVIRKRLYAGEGLSPDVRWNEDCQCVQATWDGGVTWVDNPPSDPRNNPALLAPANTELDPRCAAAAGMRAKTEEVLNAVFVASSLIDMANAILAIITVTVPGFGILIRVIFLVCEALVAIGIAALVIEFTEEAFDQLQCIFYDEISSDGTVTQEQFEAINTRICEDMSLTVCAAMGLLMNMWGYVGLSNFGALFADNTADCSDCPTEWCNLTDFTTIQGDFIGFAFPASGVWNSGVGWQSVYATGSGYGGIYNVFGLEWAEPVDFRNVIFTFNLSGSYTYGSSGVFLQYKFEGTWYTWGDPSYDPPVGTGQTISSPDFPSGGFISGVRFVAQLDASSGAADVTVTSCQTRGFGDYPFTLGDICE